MGRLTAGVLLCIGSLIGEDTAGARDTRHASPVPKAAQQFRRPGVSRLFEHRHYNNKDGEEVHSTAHPKGRQMPAGMRQTDCEGSYSFSLHRRRTCSHHVGAAKWL
ncbi:DUF3761 domain-containing protein [Acetobacter musti]